MKENLNIPTEASEEDRLKRHWPPIFNLDTRWRSLRLGGESRLSGNQLTVVCFDGRDFKADNWAVFSGKWNKPDFFGKIWIFGEIWDSLRKFDFFLRKFGIFFS